MGDMVHYNLHVTNITAENGLATHAPRFFTAVQAYLQAFSFTWLWIPTMDGLALATLLPLHFVQLLPMQENAEDEDTVDGTSNDG